MLRGIPAGLLLLLSACAAPPANAPVEEPADAALLADFRTAAYGSEQPVLGKDGQPRPRSDHLAKWQVPVRAALVDVPRADYRVAAQLHLQDLAVLTGLDVVEAPVEAANLLVFYADDPFAAARRHRGLFAHRIADARSFDALLARMAPDATCFGFLWGGWPSGQGIDFAVAFIRTDRGARTVQGCLVQQTTQVLGLMNDLDPTADSVLADNGEHVELTPRDRLILQILYDPRLKPGIGWAEAEPLARAALHDLRRFPPQ